MPTTLYEGFDVNLRENNPYSNGEIFVFPEGDFLLDRGLTKYERSANDRYFTVVEGDTLWSIANQAYKNSKWWWVIRDVNDIDLGVELIPGQTLLIPDLDTFKLFNT